ncbi:hypothetical protein BMS99_01785 [Leuconostoc mesenteroides subsp. mesenteroides]|nr:hypothetical protein BMS99_01785 [Leuconostoc mesenteroides subsp. mesenteroides]
MWKRFYKKLPTYNPQMCTGLKLLSNFLGHPVGFLQPLVAMINASLWAGYGWSKTYKDWPIIISNVPGIFFGLVTVITIYIH